jgi:hypothetical protein
MVQRAAPDRSLTWVDTGRPDLDENLTRCRNGARHIAHLENVDAAERAIVPQAVVPTRICLRLVSPCFIVIRARFSDRAYRNSD